MTSDTLGTGAQSGVANIPLPALDNGQSTTAGPGFVATTPARPVSLAWDIALPLIAAIALPFLLKYALESGVLSRFFRFSPRAAKNVAPTDEEDFDAL